jgi:hypothetical protein
MARVVWEGEIEVNGVPVRRRLVLAGDRPVIERQSGWDAMGVPRWADDDVFGDVAAKIAMAVADASPLRLTNIIGPYGHFNGKIALIRAIRSVPMTYTGTVGLKEAKEMVDEWQRLLHKAVTG